MQLALDVRRFQAPGVPPCCALGSRCAKVSTIRRTVCHRRYEQRAEKSTNGLDRSAVPSTASYVEAKADASRPSNSVFGADSAKTDESKPGSFGEKEAAAVSPSD